MDLLVLWIAMDLSAKAILMGLNQEATALVLPVIAIVLARIVESYVNLSWLISHLEIHICSKKILQLFT